MIEASKLLLKDLETDERFEFVGHVVIKKSKSDIRRKTPSGYVNMSTGKLVSGYLHKEVRRV